MKVIATSPNRYIAEHQKLEGFEIQLAVDRIASHVRLASDRLEHFIETESKYLTSHANQHNSELLEVLGDIWDRLVALSEEVEAADL